MQKDALLLPPKELLLFLLLPNCNPMKKGNLLMLGLGYAAGLLVALKFGKGGKDKDMKELSEDIKAVHSTLWTEAEQRIFSQENREKIAELKSKALSEISEFKKEAEKEIRKLVKQGKLKKTEIVSEVKKLYDNRAEILENIVTEAKSIADSVKEESEDAGKLLSKKVDSLAKDLKKDLNQKFTSLKKKIK